MNMTTKLKKSLFPVLLGLVCNLAHAGTVADDARAVSWTAENIDALKQVFPDDGAVNAFVRELYGDQEVDVGEYQIVDLRNDGKIEFVATLDFSGRGFYTSLFIVSKEDSKYKKSEILTGGASITGLKDRILDLNGDGPKEFLIPRLLGSYAGSTPTPVMVDVYAWNGQRYEQANSSFRDYYQNTILPGLQTAMTKAQQGAVTDTGALLRAKYQKEIEAVNAVLGR